MKEEKIMTEEARIRRGTIEEIIAYMKDGALRMEFCHDAIPGKTKLIRECNKAEDRAIRREIETIERNFLSEKGAYTTRKFEVSK